MAKFTTISFAVPEISIKLHVFSKTIERGKPLVVNVSIANVGNVTVKNFTTLLTSPGFSIQQQPKWPDTLYTDSQINGFYILTSNTSGTYRMWITVTYSTYINDYKVPRIRQISQMSGIDNIAVADVPFFNLPFNNIWVGTMSAVIGTFTGFMIPEISRQIASSREAKREHKNVIAKVKALLSEELFTNMKNIHDFRKSSKNNWDIVKADYLSLLSENPSVLDIFLDLYDQLQKYDDLPDLARTNLQEDKKNSYYKKIGDALKVLTSLK
jgi:hypothetical protein